MGYDIVEAYVEIQQLKAELEILVRLLQDKDILPKEEVKKKKPLKKG